MAYIDATYYMELFGSESIGNEFQRLVDIASDIIDGLCTVKPSEADLNDNRFKKAVAYEVELLEAQGGVDAILGFSEASQAGGSESLGDYSVSANPAAQQVITAQGGLPVSPMTISLLRQLGLRSRWAYAEYYRRR